MAGTIISMILTALFLGIVPVLAGSMCFFKDNGRKDTISMCYIKGMTIMMAVFQLYAVPLILTKQRFSLAVMLWILTITVILIVSLRRLNVKKSTELIKDCVSEKIASFSVKDDWFKIILTVIAIVLVLTQMYAFVAYQQLDEDDARFLVHALEAIENDTMLLRNPATGEAVDTFVGEIAKDVTSPWPIYLAVISKVVSMHPAIVAHTVLPVFLLLMVYLIYWELSRCFFGKQWEYNCIFVIIAAVLNIYGGVTRRTEFAYMLSRLWQGKAVVAGVFLPLLLLWILKIYNKPENKEYYLQLLFANIAICMLSGMGVAMGAFFVGCIGGILSLLKKDWKMLVALALMCSPNVVYAVISLFV